MPVKTCSEGGKPGYKYGNRGKCYTYTPGDETSRKTAKLKAIKQGIVISRSTGETFKP